MPDNQPLSLPRWVLPALIAAAVLLLYADTLLFGFVYDDNVQIVENTWLTSARYIPRFFTSHVWAFAGISGAYWRPLFLFWLLVQRTLFGLAPAGWHAATALVHTGATLMVFALARRLTADRVTAAVAALVFGVHPALLESVAWVSGVPDPLLVVVLIPALLFYLDWRQSRSRRALALSLFFFVLALMAKEPAIMLLPIIAAHAWIYGRADSSSVAPPFRPVLAERGEVHGRLRDVFSALLPYLPIAVVYLVFHAVLLGHVTYPDSPATAGKTLLTVPSLLLFYLRLLLWPAPVSPEYSLRVVDDFSFLHVLLPALVVAAVIVLLWAWARRLDSSHLERARVVRFASVWLFLTLAPVMYIKPLDAFDFAHARYLYLPCIGFALLVATALRGIPADNRLIAGMPTRQFGAALVLIIALAAANLVQQVHWASDLLLFTRGVTIAPNNPIALSNLGIQFGKRKRYAEALALIGRARQENPRDWHANFSLGYTYLEMGRPADAEPLIEKAMQSRGDEADPDQWAYLGIAALRIGNLSKAEWAVRTAIRRKPDVARYHHALGLILEQENRPSEAAAEFRETLKYDPSNADAQSRLKLLGQSQITRSPDH